MISNSSSLLDIEYLSDIIFEAFKLPIIFINKDSEVSTSRTFNNNYSFDFDDIIKDFLPLDLSLSMPIFKSNKYMENYISINVIFEDTYLGTFFIGPSLYFSINLSTIDEIISKNKFSLGTKPQLINRFVSIPIIEYSRLISISLIIYYLIYQEKLDVSDLMAQNSIIENPIQVIEKEFFSNLSTNRKDTFFHHSKTSEDKLFKCIKDGTPDKLKKYLGHHSDGSNGVLSKKSPLRSEKNLAICCTTIATRAAIDGGLTSEFAYTLSDSYIQLIEELNDVKDISNLMNSILITFAQKVKESKENKYSKTVSLCHIFIFNNLYEDITLPLISDYVGLNPNYLSTVFKKETGLTINECIHEKRVDESKILLTSTDYSILEISTLLKFYDQSHFTKVFKKITGLSPKIYRKSSHSL